MAVRSGINLLPDEGQDSSHRKDQKKLLNLVSIGIVGVAAGLWLIAWGVGLYFNNVDQANQTKIKDDVSQLAQMKATEVLDRSLTTKLTRLQPILQNYPHYSTLLTTVASFTPAGVKLTNLGYDATGKVTVTGVAGAPNNFGEFVNILRDPNQGGTKFSTVDVILLSGGGKQGQYAFSIVLSPKGGF